MTATTATEGIFTWLNGPAGLNLPAHVSFERDFSNGYYIGQILFGYGLIDRQFTEYFVNKHAKIYTDTHFDIIDTAFARHGLSQSIGFSSDMQRAIRKGEVGAAKKFLYKVKLELEGKGYTPGSIYHPPMDSLHQRTRKMGMAPKNTKIEHKLLKYEEQYFKQRQEAQRIKEMEQQKHKELFAQFRQERRHNFKLNYDYMREWERSLSSLHKHSKVTMQELKDVKIRFGNSMTNEINRREEKRIKLYRDDALKGIQSFEDNANRLGVELYHDPDRVDKVQKAPFNLASMMQKCVAKSELNELSRKQKESRERYFKLRQAKLAQELQEKKTVENQMKSFMAKTDLTNQACTEQWFVEDVEQFLAQQREIAQEERKAKNHSEMEDIVKNLKTMTDEEYAEKNKKARMAARLLNFKTREKEYKKHYNICLDVVSGLFDMSDICFTKMEKDEKNGIGNGQMEYEYFKDLLRRYVNQEALYDEAPEEAELKSTILNFSKQMNVDGEEIKEQVNNYLSCEDSFAEPLTYGIFMNPGCEKYDKVNQPLCKLMDEYINFIYPYKPIEKLPTDIPLFNPIRISILGAKYSGKKTLAKTLTLQIPDLLIIDIDELLERARNLAQRKEKEDLEAENEEAEENALKDAKNAKDTKKKPPAKSNKNKEAPPPLTSHEIEIQKYGLRILSMENRGLPITDELKADLILLELKNHFSSPTFQSQRAAYLEAKKASEEVKIAKEKELAEPKATPSPTKGAKKGKAQAQQPTSAEPEAEIPDWKDDYPFMNGYILLGFPATPNQALVWAQKTTLYKSQDERSHPEIEEKKDIMRKVLPLEATPSEKCSFPPLDYVFVLDMPSEALEIRYEGLRVDPQTGQLYDDTINPPDEKDKKLIARLVSLKQIEKEKAEQAERELKEQEEAQEAGSKGPKEAEDNQKQKEEGKDSKISEVNPLPDGSQSVAPDPEETSWRKPMLTKTSESLGQYMRLTEKFGYPGSEEGLLQFLDATQNPTELQNEVIEKLKKAFDLKYKMYENPAIPEFLKTLVSEDTPIPEENEDGEEADNKKSKISSKTGSPLKADLNANTNSALFFPNNSGPLNAEPLGSSRRLLKKGSYYSTSFRKIDTASAKSGSTRKERLLAKSLDAWEAIFKDYVETVEKSMRTIKEKQSLLNNQFSSQQLQLTRIFKENREFVGPLLSFVDSYRRFSSDHSKVVSTEYCKKKLTDRIDLIHDNLWKQILAIKTKALKERDKMITKSMILLDTQALSKLALTLTAAELNKLCQVKHLLSFYFSALREAEADATESSALGFDIGKIDINDEEIPRCLDSDALPVKMLNYIRDKALDFLNELETRLLSHKMHLPEAYFKALSSEIRIARSRVHGIRAFTLHSIKLMKLKQTLVDHRLEEVLIYSVKMRNKSIYEYCTYLKECISSGTQEIHTKIPIFDPFESKQIIDFDLSPQEFKLLNNPWESELIPSVGQILLLIIDLRNMLSATVRDEISMEDADSEEIGMEEFSRQQTKVTQILEEDPDLDQEEIEEGEVSLKEPKEDPSKSEIGQEAEEVKSENKEVAEMSEKLEPEAEAEAEAELEEKEEDEKVEENPKEIEVVEQSKVSEITQKPPKNPLKLFDKFILEDAIRLFKYRIKNLELGQIKYLPERWKEFRFKNLFNSFSHFTENGTETIYLSHFCAVFVLMRYPMPTQQELSRFRASLKQVKTKEDFRRTLCWLDEFDEISLPEVNESTIFVTYKQKDLLYWLFSYKTGVFDGETLCQFLERHISELPMERFFKDYFLG